MQKVITLYTQEERLKAFKNKNSMSTVHTLSSQDMVLTAIATPKPNAARIYDTNTSICFTA